MADSNVTVQKFSWPDICPSLLIFRSLPTALSLTVLVLSVLAVAAMPIGWLAMEWMFVDKEMLKADPGFGQVIELNSSPYKMFYPSEEAGSMLTVLGNPLRGIELVFHTAIYSVKGIFSTTPGIGRFLYFFGGALWTLCVWAFFGCAITRAALMRYTRDEPIGIDDAFDFAFDKFFSSFGGLAIPILAIFGLTIPMALIGFLMKFSFGAAIGGLLWGFVLLLSLAVSVIILGLAFAWPLIISSISCEGQDSFDGMSRAFAYVFQRPVHYFIYGIIAVIFTGICWLIASTMVVGTVHLSEWATSWGTHAFGMSADLDTEYIPPTKEELQANATPPLDSPPQASEVPPTPEEIAEQKKARPPTPVTNEIPEPSKFRTFGQQMVSFWNKVARTVGAAFLYGLFWSVAAAMYLLLRKDLDNTEMDEIYMVDERRTYELPPLKDDESGVPEVDEDAVLPAKVDPPTEFPDTSPDDSQDSES